MPYTGISSRWASGTLIFHEKGDFGDGAKLLSFSPSEITIGDASQDTDVVIYLGAADQYVKFDAGAATVTFAKVDTNISADVTVTLEDISVAQSKYIYLDGQDGGEYIVSDTANYLMLNATTAINFALGGTDEVNLAANVLSPAVSDGCALGSGSLMWSDLFLASAGVINFNNGDVTLTHNANYLSLGGGGLDIAGVTGLTTGAVLRMGTSGSPLTDDQNGTGFIVGYFDTGDTAGWPAGLYINTNVTGVGGNFTALQGDATISVAKGTVTGIESFMGFVTAGKVTGAARACQATIDFGNYTITTGGGVYSAACFNVKGEGSSCDPSAAQRMSCLELKTEGTFKTNCNFEKDAAGYAIYFNGFAGASGTGQIITTTALNELAAVNPIGIRVGVGGDADAGTAYYLIAVPAADWN